MPKNLPRFKDGHADLSPAHLEQLEAWLQWWELHQDMTADLANDLDDLGSYGSDDASLVSEFDFNPKEGQIRLLSHAIAGETPRPIYVVVVAAWPDGQFLATPFASSPIQSTPGEMSTGLEDFRFAIAASWNARILPQEIMESSWVVNEVGQALVDQLFRHFKALFRGFEFDADIKARAGPPIFRAEDPRWAYLQQEKEMLEYLDRECMRTVKETGGGIIEFPMALAYIQMAAASAEDRRIKVFWHKGTEEDFLRQLPDLGKGPELYGETALLNWNVEAPEKAIGEWELTGPALPSDSAPFKILDSDKKAWIGEGIIEGRTAVLTGGFWQDFQLFQSQTSSLVLVIFDAVSAE